jgi:RNA polymerase sigma-54 factor
VIATAQTMTASIEQTVEMQQAFSPLLMQANHILSLSQTALEAAIADEIAENPALEMDDCAICPVCGRRTNGEPCMTCRSAPATSAEPPRVEDSATWMETQYRAAGQVDPDFDPMAFIASAADDREQLLETALAALDSARDEVIAALIIDAIDDRGFLSVSLEEIAELAGVEVAIVERVLFIVQESAPPGVGARSLEECLLLQVEYLQREGVAVPDVLPAIIEDHLHDLGAKRIARIARALDVDPEAVEAAHHFMRSQLTPHPLQSHETPTWTAPSSGGHVVPDVVVTVDNEALVIEAPNAIYGRLRTNGFYQSLAKPHAAPNGGVNGAHEQLLGADHDAVVHAKAQVGRAQQFIWAVKQRRQTLLRVAEYVCSYQEPFIRGDARGLRPLTRSEVANALGVHESTCSRAVAGKFIMLPSRKVIPMSDLFAASLSTKHVIQQIINEESAAGRTLSDAQISERLLDYGIRIARRTVAKYRSQMHILPSTIR